MIKSSGANKWAYTHHLSKTSLGYLSNLIFQRPSCLLSWVTVPWYLQTGPECSTSYTKHQQPTCMLCTPCKKGSLRDHLESISGVRAFDLRHLNLGIPPRISRIWVPHPCQGLSKSEYLPSHIYFFNPLYVLHFCLSYFMFFGNVFLFYTANNKMLTAHGSNVMITLTHHQCNSWTSPLTRL